MVWIGSSSKIRFDAPLPPLQTPTVNQTIRKQVVGASRAHPSHHPWNSSVAHRSLKQALRRVAWSSSSASDSGPCSRSSPWLLSMEVRRLRCNSRARGTFLKCSRMHRLSLLAERREPWERDVDSLRWHFTSKALWTMKMMNWWMVLGLARS